MSLARKKASEPFRFMTRLSLPELTCCKAVNIEELHAGIDKVDSSAIFNHTHNFSMLQQYMALELVNDFAFWVKEVLQEEELAENLAFVNPGHYTHIEQVREELSARLKRFRKGKSGGKSQRTAPSGREFFFIKSDTFVFPLDVEVWDIEAFKNALRKVSLNSIFYHIFESKLRHEQVEHDFVLWIRNSLGDEDLADIISRINPYNFSLTSLPSVLADAIEGRNLPR